MTVFSPELTNTCVVILIPLLCVLDTISGVEHFTQEPVSTTTQGSNCEAGECPGGWWCQHGAEIGNNGTCLPCAGCTTNHTLCQEECTRDSSANTTNTNTTKPSERLTLHVGHSTLTSEQPSKYSTQSSSISPKTDVLTSVSAFTENSSSQNVSTPTTKTTTTATTLTTTSAPEVTNPNDVNTVTENVTETSPEINSSAIDYGKLRKQIPVESFNLKDRLIAASIGAVVAALLVIGLGLSCRIMEKKCRAFVQEDKECILRNEADMATYDTMEMSRTRRRSHQNALLTTSSGYMSESEVTTIQPNHDSVC